MPESDNELQSALLLHQKGDLKGALELYKSVLSRPSPPKVALLNTPPVLRALDRHNEAIDLSNNALLAYPFDAGLYNNLGNLYLDIEQDFNAISCYRKALSIKPDFVDARLSLITLLLKQNLYQLAYATAIAGLKTSNDSNQRLIVPFLESYYRLPEEQRGSIDDFQRLLDHLEDQLEADDEKIATIKILLTNVWLQIRNLDKAAESLDSLRQHIPNLLKPGIKLKQSFIDNWNSLNWNLSISYLKSGRLKEGWSLFDFGLRVNAEGPQRWQRALKKPFGSATIPLWRGESLANKRLLLLGEQGIGDTMMFATLINSLLKRGCKIYFIPGSRLNLIYKESMPNVTIITTADLQANKYSSSSFDFQSPIGSICQYGYDNYSAYATNKRVLVANQKLTSEYKQRYFKDRPLVGISWQGGGKEKRIRQKSCSLKDLLPILKRKDCDFVSLQYGNDGPMVDNFNKKYSTSIIHDETVDPIKDMYSWLSQVAAMDFVISIANTTVHGSGGLGVPTMCLVSTNSDWRWVDPKIYAGNYWYESVDATYQSEDGRWYDAVSEANEWLDRHLK